MVSVEIPSPLAGGIGTSISNLYQHLKDKINLTLLISSRYIKNAEILPENSIVIPSLGRSVLEIMSFGKNAAKYISKHHNEFDVIHLHLPLALGILKYLEGKVLKKTLVTFHTTYVGYKNMFKLVKWSEIKTFDDILGKICYYSVMSKLEKKLSKKIKHASAVSSGVANEIRTFYGIDEVEVIPNGIKVDNERRKRKKDDIIFGRILFVGRLVMQKGIIDLIKATYILRNDGYSFKLNVCGCGYLKEVIQDYICKKRLNNYIKLLGYVPRDYLTRLYETSQIAVIPSLYEGLPMVGLELASAGLPIVATETARVQDIVCDRNIELLVPSRDFKGLANKIGYLLENLDHSINIGNKNIEKCNYKCNLNKIGFMYLKLYNISCG